MYKLFVYSCNIFPVIYPNNCYVILTTYMLDSALELSYNLSKNLSLQLWILKLIVDMVNDSAPLLIGKTHAQKEWLSG